MNTKYLRLPNGNTIDYYNETITDTCFIVEFIQKDFKTIKDFFGTDIIDYVDILDENKNLIKTYDIYAIRQECIFESTTIQEVETKIIKEAYTEIIPAVIDESTNTVIELEKTIEHEAETEEIVVEIPVDLIKVRFRKPRIEDEVNNIKKVVGIVNTSNMTLEEYKDYYKSLIGEECTKAIYNGCDVDTSLGTKHFSYTLEDQNNIQDLFVTVIAADSNISLPYHADGEYCTIYEGIDIAKMFATLSSNKIYHTTYCNILNRTIENQTSIDDIKNITYGMEITDENDKELLSNITSQGQSTINTLLEKFGITNE